MGAQFRVTIHENVDLSSIVDKFEGTVVGASIAGGEDLNALDLTDSTLMLVGSEGAGLTDDLLSKVDHCVSITLAKDVESLNVASATAILCYQMSLRA
jgi:TrmH family RNA methyltransferase